LALISVSFVGFDTIAPEQAYSHTIAPEQSLIAYNPLPRLEYSLFVPKYIFFVV